MDLIVFDDGSIDNSAKIAQSYIPQIRHLYQPNAGIGGAMKKGVELATGEFLAFLDSDDIWMSNKWSWQMTILSMKSGTDAVFSQIEQFYSSDMSPELQQKYHFAQEIINAYCADTILARRNMFFRVGNFNPDFRSGAFLDWFTWAKDLRLKFDLIPVVLAKRRIHDINFGIQNKSVQHIEYTRILKAAIDRRRADKKDSGEGQVR